MGVLTWAGAGMLCWAPRRSRLRQDQGAGVGGGGDPAQEAAAASRASPYLPPRQERPPQHVFLTRQLPWAPAPWGGQEALTLPLRAFHARPLLQPDLVFRVWGGAVFIYLENIFFFLRKKVNCCGLGRMLWPSHADFWGAGSGHRGAARSWPAFRCPWAEVTAEPPRRLCRLQPVLSGGQALLARFPGRPWRARVSAAVRGPGSRGGRYALRPAGAGHSRRAASAKLGPAPSVPRKHVWGSGGLRSDYLWGHGRVVPRRLDSACLDSSPGHT